MGLLLGLSVLKAKVIQRPEMLCSSGMKLFLCTGRMLRAGRARVGGASTGCHGDLDFTGLLRSFMIPLGVRVYSCKPRVPDSFDPMWLITKMW